MLLGLWPGSVIKDPALYLRLDLSSNDHSLIRSFVRSSVRPQFWRLAPNYTPPHSLLTHSDSFTRTFAALLISHWEMPIQRFSSAVKGFSLRWWFTTIFYKVFYINCWAKLAFTFSFGSKVTAQHLITSQNCNVPQGCKCSQFWLKSTYLFPHMWWYVYIQIKALGR